MLIRTAFLNIIFGIIIDTFAGKYFFKKTYFILELRETNAKIDEDMKNTCYICGIERE